MLGMTAAAVTVFLKPNWFSEKRLHVNIAKACFGYALIIPVTVIIICLTPLVSESPVMGFFALILVTIVSLLPFYCSGIAITSVLTKCRLPIGKLYASDLFGAAAGCIFVLLLLKRIDAVSLILLSGSVALLAVISFLWHSPFFYLKRSAYLAFGALTLFAIANSLTLYGIRPCVAKGSFENPGDLISEKWNSFSRVSVYKDILDEPQYWGKSPAAPSGGKVRLHALVIDGCAGTILRKFTSIKDIEHLHFDLPNLAYYLRPNGGACIIGVGGGKDIQSAILFGHERIVGVDINPIFIDLIQNKFGDFAGIAGRKEVSLITDEARSYLSREDEKFSIIQMSLIDTWAATTAGAYSLSENSLYTVEAWKIFLSRLKDDGIFTVSRWYNPNNISETGRMISLAAATLLDSGIEDPSQHIAVITINNLATLLLSKQPFTDQDIMKLRRISWELRFNLEIYPGMKPNESLLYHIASSRSLKELDRAIAGEIFNFKPTTDENPYFFNMLRIGHLNPSAWPKMRNAGILYGNITASIVLGELILCLFFSAIVTIVLPLFLRAGSKRPKNQSNSVFWPAAVYFSLIGAGFMFVEIALIQRLSVFLGHPVYALGILLLTIIASAGIGSFLSERISLTDTPGIYIYPLAISIGILITRVILTEITLSSASSPMIIKIFWSIFVIAPLGVGLGMCFPAGMRLVKDIRLNETPWYWALNGIFSVLCSAIAVFISIYFGISTSFYIAGICYLLLLPCLFFMHRAKCSALH